MSVVVSIINLNRNTHKLTAQRVYGERRVELKPFLFWLPDNERLRGLGEFEIDEERVREGWGGGVERKFHSVYSKYSVSFLLTNPSEGMLSQTRDAEGGKYRLHERIERLVEEFGKNIGILA